MKVWKMFPYGTLWVSSLLLTEDLQARDIYTCISFLHYSECFLYLDIEILLLLLTGSLYNLTFEWVVHPRKAMDFKL